jgi:hypothetical protein
MGKLHTIVKQKIKLLLLFPVLPVASPFPRSLCFCTFRVPSLTVVLQMSLAEGHADVHIFLDD